MAQETPVQRLERILGAGSVSRAPRYIETPIATSRRLLAMGIPQTYETPYEPPQDDGEGLADMLMRRAGQGAGRFFSSNLNPLNLVALTSRGSASLARELTDLFDSDSDNKASFGDFFKQTFDTSYGYGTAFPMKGWKGRIFGFTGDVLLDPLTYATFGGTAVAKGAAMAGRAGGKAVARAAAKEFVAENAARMGRMAARKAARGVYKETLERAAREFGTAGGRAVLGKQVYGREGRQKLAQHVDRLMQEAGKDMATRQDVAARVAARGKSALYDSAEGMEMLSRLGVSGPGLYYFGSRVKVPGSDVLGKMLERGVTATRLGVSRSAPVSRMLRNFVPEGTGRLLNLGPDTVAEIRAGLQIGKTIMVDGREIDPVMGLKMLEWDDLRRIGVAEATDNWDAASVELIARTDAWTKRYGAEPHLFFDQANYLGRTGFNNAERLAEIERLNPGATAELRDLFDGWEQLRGTIKGTLDGEAEGTGRVIGNIDEGYVPRMYTPEFAEWTATHKWPDDVDMNPSRYMGSLKNRTLEPGMEWFGHTLAPEDLTIDRLNYLALLPTEEWFKTTAREIGTTFDKVAPPPKPFVEDTAGIFLRYVRQQAEQVGTFRMVKAMLENPEYARALDSVVPTPEGAEHVAREAAEAAGRYQAALAEYHAAVRAIRVALDASFDAVASRTLIPLADDAGTRSSLQLVAAQIESGDLAPEVIDDVADGIGQVIDNAVAQIEQLEVSRADFEPMLQNDSGVVEGNYSHIVRQLDELKRELSSIQELYRQGQQIGAPRDMLPNWQRNRILADILERMERYSAHAESVIADINRWASVENVVPRLDKVGNVDAESFFRALLRLAPESEMNLKLPKDVQGFSLFSQKQYRRRTLRALPKLRSKKGKLYDANGFGSLTKDEFVRLKNFYSLHGKKIEDSVRRVANYTRARQAISSALKTIAEGKELSKVQRDNLYHVINFVVFKHGQSEVAGLPGDSSYVQRLLYDKFIVHRFVSADGNRTLPVTDELLGTHAWLARISDNTAAASVQDLYQLQDMLHFAASTEQLWEIRTALQGMGITVGDDVISQILLHNSDDYVVDALRLNDAVRLEQLRPTEGRSALPYGRRAGERGDFGDTWSVEIQDTLEDIGNEVLAAADSAKKKVDDMPPPPKRLASGVNMIKRHLFARLRNARMKMQGALEEISSIDQSIRTVGHRSRARVRVETPEITEKAVALARRKLRGPLDELNFHRRFGMKQYFAPLQMHMSTLGYTPDESTKIINDWLAQYGGRFEHLIDSYLRFRGIKTGQVFTYSQQEYDSISFFLGGVDMSAANKFFDIDELEAVIVTVLRGVFEDSARFIDEEYSMLVEAAQIRYLEAVQEIASVNAGLDTLRANPYAELVLSDDLDAIDFSRLQPGIESDEFGEAAVEMGLGSAGRQNAELQLEIDALEGSEQFIVAKSVENYFTLAQQLARINIPEGEDFFGLTAETLDDFLAGVVRGEGGQRIGLSPEFYRLASDPRANPTGDIASYMRLRVEEYIAAGNVADPDVVARRVNTLNQTWENNPSYRYLKRINELKAEKFDRAVKELSPIDDVEILLKRLRDIQRLREKHFGQIRFRTYMAYRQIDESAAQLGQQSDLVDTFVQRGDADVNQELFPGIDPEDAANVAQSLESQLRAQGIFGVEDVSLNQSAVLMDVFEKSVDQVLYANRLNAEDLLTRYTYLFEMGAIEDTSRASEFLTQAEYVIEMIRKMQLIDPNVPPALKSERNYFRMIRRLRRVMDDLNKRFPDSRSAHRADTVRLFTGDPERRLPDIPEFGMGEVIAGMLQLDPKLLSGSVNKFVRGFTRRFLETRASLNEFVLRDFPDPEVYDDDDGKLARLLIRAFKLGDGKDAVGYELVYYNADTGRAVFRNVDADADEIVPTTERFDPSITAGGRLERSTQEEADALMSRSGPSDYIGRDDQVALPPEFKMPVRTETGPRLDLNAPRAQGAVPARTFDSLEQLRAALGIEDAPVSAAALPEPVPMPLVVSGHSPKGRGTPLGDGKDVAMRKVADSAIVELDSTGRASSSRTTIDALGAPGVSSRVVMLARNGSLRGRPLRQETIDAVRQAHDNGARFVVGDMPQVDEQFVALLDEIGALYTVYTSGTPRITIRGYGSAGSPAVLPESAPMSAEGARLLADAESLTNDELAELRAVGRPAAAAPSVQAPPTPIPTAVAAYDPVEAITTPNVLSSAEKAQQGKDKLEWLVSRIPADASDQWRAAFTNFVDRATVWLEQMSETGELDPGLMALLGSHFEAEMAFMEAAAEMGERSFDRAMVRFMDDFTSMTDVVEASVYFKDPRKPLARKLVEEAIERHFPAGWQQLHYEYYPNIIVSDQLKQFWSMADFRRDPAWMDNGFIDALKEMNKFHKSYAVLTPGFHVRNAIGNAFTLFFAGADMKNVARGVGIYRRMQAHLKTGAPIDAFFASLDPADAAIVRTAREATFGAGGGIFSSTYQEAAEGGRLAFLYKNRLTRKNYEIGQYSDDVVRFALGFDIVARGGDRDAAQVAIKRFFFDYEDLSKADRYIKEIIPFWLWSSRNFVSQIQNIFLNPKRYVIYTNLKKNLRSDDEERTQKQLPFVAELGGFELPVGRNLYFVPDMGAARAVQLPMEYGSYKLVNSFTPWARVPIETVFNRRSFTDKPVYDEPKDLAGYLMSSFLPPVNQADRMGILPGGKPINWNAISSYLGNPVRQYGG